MEIDRTQRIGLMGGSFNPIHYGHLCLAREAYRQKKLDRILFLPCGTPYRKKRIYMASGADRFRMTELAVKGYPQFAVSDMEIRWGGNTYTCDTLRQLVRENSGCSYYFIVGADCLFSVENWKRPDVIFENCIFLVGMRNGVNPEGMCRKKAELEKIFGARIEILSFPDIPVSSTLIRERIKHGENIRYLVPESVRNYMEEKHIYTE